ncbi:hypothetical protein SERLA73DRAFT_74925 [Serpula lacrymans var. lacrymans S7.3]|uniref:Solute carrier family 40 protein n=1 Tax=Serpula lacrymans var. lacrymans (strain S7.3) TaxID=936435 RepID=F8Q204_SERL3|nr:hypothetical protein SERLA73DRAFT_74925 [Serpula lacrymans var. lacrymans S7.3]
MSVSRAFSVLCILPLVKVLYRRVVSEDSVQLDVAQSEPLFGTRESTEDSPRAEVSNDANADASNAPSADVSIEDTLRAQKARKLSAKQELLICRVCFLIDTLGMLLVSVSKSPTQVSIAVAIGSLGAPAVPSLQTLTTLASPPSELGRVLAALSIIESAVLALRSPILFGIYNLTLGSSPEVVWWCSAALLLVCGLAMQLLKPARFLSEIVEYATADSSPESSEAAVVLLHIDIILRTCFAALEGRF